MSTWAEKRNRYLGGFNGYDGHVTELGASSLHALMRALLIIHIEGVSTTGGRSFVVRPDRFEFNEEDISFCFTDPLIVDIDRLDEHLTGELAGLRFNDELAVKHLHHHERNGWLATGIIIRSGDPIEHPIELKKNLLVKLDFVT
ncbi:MAG: hypothetical protein QOG91_455 [Candidatus Parcubacteria bacterium]|jgi:hypothetical protein|nr:hypothetical protein [Candidatus Parcubacteria bacterium]